MNAFPSLKLSVLAGDRTFCQKDWADNGKLDIIDPFSRLYFVSSGNGSVIHSGKLFELRPGKLFVIPANVSGRYRSDGCMDLYWIHYKASVYGDLEPFRYFGWNTVAKLPEYLDVKALMNMAITCFRQHNLSGMLTAEGAVRILIAGFTGSAQRDPDFVRFLPVFDFIDANLQDRITLSDLADTVSLHPTYFSNLFRSIVGQTPMKFVNQRRIESVAAGLRSNRESLAELADKYCFTDAFHLSKLFKDIMGMSPKCYRNETWRENEME